MLSERRSKNAWRVRLKKHADLADAVERSLTALDVLTAQLNSITTRLIAFSDLIGGPLNPKRAGTLAPGTDLN